MFSLRFICVTTVIVLLLPIGALAQVRKKTSQQFKQAPSPKAMLDLAIYYYNSDDLTGRAEESFKKLLTKNYEGTSEYETAQYYLAAYYQRKFYLQKAKQQYSDWNALKQSKAEYRKYTDTFYKKGKRTWLSDSFFNLALVNLQLGDVSSALDELSKIKDASNLDPTVYIYQIVWSPQSQTVVDSYLPASRLADYTMSVVKSDGYYFEKAVLQLQKWCQSQR